MRILLLAVLLAGCSAEPGSSTDPPRPRGNRTLAIDVNAARDEEFGEALALVTDLGASQVGLSLGWDEIETSPGVYNPPVNYLSFANTYYPGFDIAVALTLSSIDTNNDRRPADLRGLAWDDPAVLARYRGLLDWAFTQIPDLTLGTLVVGNEADALLDASADWAAYARFTSAAVAHAHTLRPGVTTGVKLTFNGLTGDRAPRMAATVAAGDALLVTYYPLRSDFSIRPPDSPRADFAALVEQYPGREIRFLEAGYPAGSVTGSTDADQAAFVRALFAAWDDNADAISTISWSFLTDFSPAEVQQLLSYYGIGSDAFASYLGTLGLRRYDGSSRPALAALREAADARGW